MRRRIRPYKNVDGREEQLMAKKIPMRQCIGCGEMKPKKDMMRILKSTDDRICLDTTG